MNKKPLQSKIIAFTLLFASLGSFFAFPAHASTKYPANTVVQALDSGSIYYVASDGRRYQIPNMGVYHSWYADFSVITSVPTERDLARMGKSSKQVTVRPGTTLIMFGSSPKVYTVDTGAVIRWITSPDVAESLYGLNWKSRVVALPQNDRNSYVLGVDIHDPTTFSRHLASTETNSIEDELRARKIVRVKPQTRVADIKPDVPLLKQLRTDVNHGLTPGFRPGTVSYRLTANSYEDRVTITATASSPDNEIFVNDTAVPSGLPIVLTLDSGLNSVTIVVRAKTGAAQSYMILVDRTPINGNPYLQSIAYNISGRLAPVFTQSVDTYDLRAEYLEGSIVVRPVLQDKRGRTWVNGILTKNGASHLIPLGFGENIITIKTNAQNGAERIYTLKVFRNRYPRTDEMELKSLQENLAANLSPAFDPHMSLYDLVATADEATVRITARPRSRSATVYINGEEGQTRVVPLSQGKTNITITVAVSAEQLVDYTIHVDRQDPR